MSLTLEKNDFYGWKNATVLFTLYFCVLGFVFYGFSVIFPLMIKSQGWSRGDAAIAHSLRGLFVGGLTPLVAWFINKKGSKKTFFFGLIISLVALILLGTVTKTLWQWTLIWGVIMPFGFALAGLVNVQTTTLFWFNKKRGAALGFVLSGAAIAGFIASPTLTYLMKKSGSWQTGWLACAVAIGLALIALIKLVNKPSDIGQYPDGIDPDGYGVDSNNDSVKPSTYRTADKWSVKKAIKTPTIALYFIVLSAQLMTVYLLMVHGVLHLTDVGYTRMEAASLISFILIGGALARFPMGVLADKIEPRWILSMAYLVMLPAMLVIWKAPSLTLVLTAALIYGFCFGTTITICPTILGNYFGAESFPGINGFVMPFAIVLSATIPFAAGYSADYFGNYNLPFIFISGIILCAALASAAMSPPVLKD